MDTKTNMKNKNDKLYLIVLIPLLIIVFLLSLCVGRYQIAPAEVFRMLGAKLTSDIFENEGAATVFWTSRFPRVCAGALIGCALSVAGASYQGIFRNPMVSPDLLGASAGAGFGAALGFLLGVNTGMVTVMAFISGVIAVIGTIAVSHIVGEKVDNSRILLVLCGIVTGSLFQAFISIIKVVADPYDTLPSITFWLMGGLNYVTASQVKFLIFPILIGGFPLLLVRWKINLMSFGEDEAKTMGIQIERFQLLIIGCATLMTAGAVSVGGMIGWVGLIVPHFARMMVGADYRRLLPCAAVLGAIFTLLVDDISRSLMAQEIPIGILTAILGAPVFLLLLSKGKRGFM